MWVPGWDGGGGHAAGSTVGKPQDYLKTYPHKMPRSVKRREGQASRRRVVRWGTVALRQSSIMRWSLGEKGVRLGGQGLLVGMCACGKEGGVRQRTAGRCGCWQVAGGCLEVLCKGGWAGAWEWSRGCLCMWWVSEQEQTGRKHSPELG